jgi:hypothetical protein
MSVGRAEKCGICDQKEGKRFCVRCWRAICDDCWNGEWDLCGDCATYKRAEKWNLSQAISNTLNISDYSKNKLDTDCSGCKILRDHLLYLIKRMKDVESAADIEALPDIASEARRARETITQLGIKVLVKQKMRAPREPWGRL